MDIWTPGLNLLQCALAAKKRYWASHPLPDLLTTLPFAVQLTKLKPLLAVAVTVVSGGGTFAAGSSDTVIATANSGYNFVNWTDTSGNILNSSPSYTFTVSGNVTLVANFTPTQQSSDPVPSNRRINWTYTGVPGGIPNRTTICATFSPGATAAAITSAINACNNGVVLLNAGTYTSASLGGTIQLYKSNVTLRGAGADQTILTGKTIINLGNGFNVSLGTAITNGATKGSTAVTVASTANLSVGTMIEIDTADDTNLIVNTGRQGGGTRNMTQVNMITAVSGNTITMRNPLIYDFAAGSPRVKFYFGGITRNSGVENLKLDHGGFSGGSYNFLLQYCDSCWIKGVDSGRATGYHFIIVGTLTWNCAIPTSTMVVLGATIAGSTFTAITRRREQQRQDREQHLQQGFPGY